jgi:hypothetical protein
VHKSIRAQVHSCVEGNIILGKELNARMCAFDTKIGLFLTGFTGLTCCGQSS